MILPSMASTRLTPCVDCTVSAVMQVKLLDGERALIDTDVRLQNRGVMLFSVDQDSRVADGALVIMLKAED